MICEGNWGRNGAKSFFVQSQIQNLVGWMVDWLIGWLVSTLVDWLGSPFTLPSALKTLHFILAKVCSSVFFVVQKCARSRGSR